MNAFGRLTVYVDQLFVKFATRRVNKQNVDAVSEFRLAFQGLQKSTPPQLAQLHARAGDLSTLVDVEPLIQSLQKHAGELLERIFNQWIADGNKLEKTLRS